MNSPQYCRVCWPGKKEGKQRITGEGEWQRQPWERERVAMEEIGEEGQWLPDEGGGQWWPREGEWCQDPNVCIAKIVDGLR